MRSVPLGPTGIRLSPIGLGCWQFSKGRGLGGRYWPSIEQAVIDGIVDTSLAEGIDWFDTAELYGNGASEEALASALRAAGRAPGSVVIATKWFPFLRRASHIKRSIGERIERLRPFPIDLHQIHQRVPGAPVTAQMNAMADLVEAGRIRSVGVSNFGARAMRKAHAALARRGVPLAANQVRYNLLDRRIERNGVAAAARELGVTIIAYSPLAQGLLSGKFHAEPGLVRRLGGVRSRLPAFRAGALERIRPLIDELSAIARRHEGTAAQVALAWLIHPQGGGAVAIPGASGVEQARENARALYLALEDAEVARLGEVSRAVIGR
jgi:aryl-alcohol dehydrogenase-like predicted oxidoreductase